jgi:hypothetical protein
MSLPLRFDVRCAGQRCHDVNFPSNFRYKKSKMGDCNRQWIKENRQG